jgi:hydroxymethylglutaryl-CoA lyase
VLPVPERIELIGRLAAAGASRIETVSFAHPDLVPQMAGAEAICEALDRRTFSAIGLVLNERGLDRALDCDLDEVNLVAYGSDGYALENSNAPADRRNAEAERLTARARDAGLGVSVTIAVAFGDPIEGRVPASRVAEIAGRMAAAGADEIALGDTIGVAVPTSVTATVDQVRNAIGSARIRCHFHNTRNTGYANAVAALQAGVVTLDASVGGFGGSPFSPQAGGNLATEDLAWMLAAMGWEHPLDPPAVADTGVWLAQRLGHDRPPAMLARAAPWPTTAPT